MSVFIGIFLVAVIIIRFISGLAITFYRSTHQPPPEAPNVAFGKLAKPNFVNNYETTKGFSFILQNIEGKPPETTPSGRVYAMPKKSYSFESGEKAKELARKLGFEGEPRIDNVFYYFSNFKDPNLSLFIDSTHMNFQLKYNYINNPEIFNLGRISSNEEATDKVRNYLVYSNVVDESAVSGLVTTEFLVYDGRLQKLVPATSLSTAQAVRINYFRPEVAGMKVLTDEFKRSYNYAIYAPTPGTEAKNIIEISYYFWPVTLDNPATYPIISGEEAYQALLDGKATVINKGKNSDSISIRNVYTAYYDSKDPQNFLQPVFVFEGDNDFAAYYPAINPEYLE